MVHTRRGFGVSAESAEVVDSSPESSGRRTGCREAHGGCFELAASAAGCRGDAMGRAWCTKRARGGGECAMLDDWRRGENSRDKEKSVVDCLGGDEGMAHMKKERGGVMRGKELSTVCGSLDTRGSVHNGYHRG